MISDQQKLYIIDQLLKVQAKGPVAYRLFREVLPHVMAGHQGGWPSKKNPTSRALRANQELWAMLQSLPEKGHEND